MALIVIILWLLMHATQLTESGGGVVGLRVLKMDRGGGEVGGIMGQQVEMAFYCNRRSLCFSNWIARAPTPPPPPISY